MARSSLGAHGGIVRIRRDLERMRFFFSIQLQGMHQWSVDAGNPHTQRLAVSLDGGGTLEKRGMILGHIKGDNRDPKVFYHKESAAYIMTLFLDGNEFAIFHSQDLLHRTESQRLIAENMQECPICSGWRWTMSPGRRSGCSGLPMDITRWANLTAAGSRRRQRY